MYTAIFSIKYESADKIGQTEEVIKKDIPADSDVLAYQDAMTIAEEIAKNPQYKRRIRTTVELSKLEFEDVVFRSNINIKFDKKRAKVTYSALEDSLKDE